jgi:hypothetical protein
MHTQDIREEALNTKLLQEDVPTPFWPKSNGHVALVDIPTDELNTFQPLAKTDQAAYIATLLCKALINKENGERIFQEADRDMVKRMGGAMLTPVFKQATKFFGAGAEVDKAAADAKKN